MNLSKNYSLKEYIKALKRDEYIGGKVKYYKNWHIRLVDIYYHLDD